MTTRRSHSSGRVTPFPNIAFLERLRPSRMKLGLENITRLLERLGNPHEAFPSVLIGGTNGKGSVATYITSILRAAGLSVGTFYSPHIFRIQERIRLDGDEIPTPVFDEILGRLRREHRTIPFTFFEGVTAAAALYFKERGVDIAVFEVGLGGRLDATRLVDAVVTVVTGISKDHMVHLGSTCRRILDEKLGIARSGVPLVANLGDRRLVAHASRRCASVGSPFIDVNGEVKAAATRIDWRRLALTVETPVRDYGTLETGLIGAVQVRNVATAVRVAELLDDFYRHRRDRRVVQSDVVPAHPAPSRRRGSAASRQAEECITTEAIRAGIGRAFIPCRFQVLAGKPRIVLDVSHNEEGLLAVVDTLLRLSPRGRNVLVFGVMAHKELGRFPHRAVGAFREIICTALKKGHSMPGASLGEVFRRAAAERGGVTVTAARGMVSALRVMRKIAGPEDTVVICGSHLAVEEATGLL
ncbi:MAG TPA: Mur ligase family protein [Patescibacteria group bacterium]|nr:Mur ligase family protein [Patescibacteria group bacterium]